MESTFKIWQTNRNKYAEILDRFTLDQLKKLPEGFSNNLIWNISHVVAIQQSILYRSSGLPMNIPIEFLLRYKPGTKPEMQETQADIDFLKLTLLPVVDTTLADYKEGKFQEYKEFTTLTGFHIANFKEGIEFNNYHEAMHMGLMMNVMKFI